jgi:hypothetical protein
MTIEQKYAIGGVALLVAGYFGYKWYQSKQTAVVATPTTKEFDLNSFLNGTWEAAYDSINHDLKGSDELIIKDNVIEWKGKPEFTIVGKVYDDTTKTLHLSYDRMNSTDKFDAVFIIDKAKKVMTGTENDGQINLVWTKK